MTGDLNVDKDPPPADRPPTKLLSARIYRYPSGMILP